MKKNTLSILLIIESLITILLLFVNNIELYIVSALFLFIGMMIGYSLLFRKLSAKESYVFITLFVSIIYLLLVFYEKNSFLTIMSAGQICLFLISSILVYEKSPKSLPKPIKPEKYQETEYKSEYEKPKYKYGSVQSLKEEKDSIKPGHITIETYDLEELEHDIDKLEKEEKRKKDEEYVDAMAYELEREALELKRAEKFINKKNIENTKLELIKEAKALEDASKKANMFEREIKREELKREAKEIQEAEKKIRDLDFLNKQQELNRQAIELVKAQAEINKAAKNKARIKTVTKKIAKKDKKDNPVFATYNGNSFHETGCMVIKKIPKKNLILFNNQKEALKKGYKPCNVCKP